MYNSIVVIDTVTPLKLYHYWLKFVIPLKLVILPVEPPVTFKADQSQEP